VLSTQARLQPLTLGAISVQITTSSSVTLSWVPIPSSLEMPEFMAKCRVSGDTVRRFFPLTLVLTATIKYAQNGPVSFAKEPQSL